jgi:hypothetical protein
MHAYQLQVPKDNDAALPEKDKDGKLVRVCYKTLKVSTSVLLALLETADSPCSRSQRPRLLSARSLVQPTRWKL